MAISSLNTNEIINISSDFAHIYNLKKEEQEKIKEILIERGYKKFYIYRYIAKVKNFIIKSEKNKFTMEVPTVRERHFMEEINRACYIKIVRRRTVESSMHQNEVYALVNVYL